MKKKFMLCCAISLISLMLFAFPCSAKDTHIIISQFPVGPSAWSAKNMIDAGIYKKWGEKASIKFRISKLSVRLTNKIENRRLSQENLRKEISV